jgi:predicted enzyme related to lactoylglutathione lyase
MGAKQHVMFEIHASDLERAGRFYTQASNKTRQRVSQFSIALRTTPEV